MARARASLGVVVLDRPECARPGGSPGYPCGHVLAIGGRLYSTELYDPEAGSWRVTAPLATAPDETPAVLLADGRVLVAGGQTSKEGAALNSAEVYDPAEETWSAAWPMAVARFAHTATRLEGLACAQSPRPAWCDKVLVVGGTQVEESRPGLASTEIFDPATASWAASGELSNARTDHTATLLPSGQVLVAGGVNGAGPWVPRDGVAYASAELYDPGSGTWRLTGSMAIPRFAHSATVLADGRASWPAGWSTRATEDHVVGGTNQQMPRPISRCPSRSRNEMRCRHG